jgi:acetyl-CoA carboxylase biotin carboxyl carrier protein
MVHSTDIVELELKSKKFKLAVKKREALEVPPPPPQVRG